jgi:pyruvate dehydrogenase E2 component (dihydrolipoamide acetyltransferase)
MASESGLVVPVIAAAEELDEVEIARELTRLRAASDSNRLRTADLAGGTFTISNLGMFAVDKVSPVVNPGQAAILGIGRVRTVPVYAPDGLFVPTPTACLTLGVDHRAADGAAAARFLADCAAAVEADAS